MPTYEYQCNNCAHKFEAFQQIKEQPLKICPKCQGSVKRLISAGGGFIFKGPGFYATDYRKKECPASGDSQACKQCPAKNRDGSA